MNRFMIHGTRSSYPVWGERWRRYSGNTSCFSLETDEGLIIFDAGTGITSIGDALAQRTRLPPVTILFTHFHLDHIIGAPAFKPFYRKDARITLMADPVHVTRWQEVLKMLFRRPLWPVKPLEAGATVRFKHLPGRGPAAHPASDSMRRNGATGSIELYGAKISWCPVWHPQRCLSYRIETTDRVIVLAPDREHGHKALDARFTDFCRGTDILIHDAQYTPEEYPSRFYGWGHSTWEHGVRIAVKSGARTLLLTSHDPGRSDDDIDHLVKRAQRIFPNTRGATENMVVT